jgi:hypothetical protein
MRRKKRTHKRRKGLSAAAPHRTTHRRRTHRKRGLMDGILSKHGLIENGTNALLGAAGGVGASVAAKALASFNMGFIGKLASGVGIGFVASAFGFPKLGIGFAGGMGAIAMETSGLHDDAPLMDDDLSELPVYQTEDGQFVKMLNDGTIEPLSEQELEEAGIHDNIYPSYSTMNGFQH